MKSGVFLCLSLLIVLVFSGFVIANGSDADVVYIVKNPDRKPADSGFLDAFSDLGLSVKVISDREAMSKDLSVYDIIFLGNERLRSAKKLNLLNYDHNLIVANRHYSKNLGFTTYSTASKKAASAPLMVRGDGTILQVYKNSIDRRRKNLFYYYIDERKRVPGFEPIVSLTQNSHKGKQGDVISYYEGSQNQFTSRKCFFGIPQTKYWTDEAEVLFKNCVNFVDSGVRGELPEGTPGDGGDGEFPSGGQEWMCQSDGTIRDNCLSFSNPNSEGKITRCYLELDRDVWDFCSGGWIEVE
jgi:hypothetical protein